MGRHGFPGSCNGSARGICADAYISSYIYNKPLLVISPLQDRLDFIVRFAEADKADVFKCTPV